MVLGSKGIYIIQFMEYLFRISQPENNGKYMWFWTQMDFIYIHQYKGLPSLNTHIAT